MREPNARLHLILSMDAAALRDCVSLARPGDTLLLADQGAGWLLNPDRLAALAGEFQGALAATEADVRALGLARFANAAGVRQVTDARWVRMLHEHGQVLSWR